MVKDIDKLIGKKLSDAISMVDDNLIISIGSASAFFFIGTKRDYENKIDKISVSFVDYNKGLMDKYKSLIENAIEILIRHESTTKERVEAIGKLKKYYCPYKKCEKYLNTYTPLSDRKVKDAYLKINKEHGICISVDGTESGNYWNKEEWDADQDEKTQKYDMG